MKTSMFGLSILPFVLLPALAASGGGVGSTRTLDVVNSVLADKRNVVLSILDCKLDGFKDDRYTARVPYVRRSAEHGRVIATVPRAGTFYPGFLFYDTSGDERFRISIDGVERGVAVADEDDNRDRLFFLTEPYRFHGGEQIELQALTTDGVYHTEDLILLREKPPLRKRQFSISNLSALADVHGQNAEAELAWVTSWPAACRVEWGAQGVQQTSVLDEETAFSNHRASLHSLKPGETYRFRVSAKTPGGAVVASEWQNFSVQPPVSVEGSVKSATLPLAVRNPQQNGRTGVFPVTSGIPFPQGTLGSDTHVRLLDSHHREVPLQTETLARWKDGTAKWVLLDFQGEAPHDSTYTLEYGSDVRRQRFPSPLKVVETGDRINVETGPLRFTISKRRFGLPDALWSDGERVVSPDQPGVVTLIGEDGTRYLSLGAPDAVKVEEAGPLRAVVWVRGSYRAADGRTLLRYSVRIHAYAGKRFLRVQHTYENNNELSEFTSIRSMTFRLPVESTSAADARRWALGGDGEMSGTFDGAAETALRQHTDDKYVLSQPAGKRAADGKRAAGWMDWSDPAHRVTLAVRDFWQTYPKDLAVTAGALEVGLCPKLGKDEYTSASGTVDEHRLYYYLQNGSYKLRQGVSQTQDIWLEFSGERPVHPAAVRTQREPLLAIANPEWYAGSHALGRLATGNGSMVTRYDSAFSRAFSIYLDDREYLRSYGMLNFGDWWGERGIDWGNSEYDTQNSFFLQFVRTGDSRYFKAGEEMEWHNRDVDTIHSHSDRSRIGGVYHHSVGHTGGYYEKSPPPGTGIVKGILTVDHVFVQGHLAYYFLTGDRRSLETARLIGDRYDAYDTRNYDFNNCRNAGWHLILTMALYNATGDRYYLNAANIIVERVLERQTPDGGWDFYRICLHPDPVHFGNFGFTVGVMLTGLRDYYEATGDERVAREIVRGAYFFVNKLWLPDSGTFKYTSCPIPSDTRPMLTFVLLDGIAFAHRQTKDPALKQVLLKAADKALLRLAALDPDTARKEMSGVGKELGTYIADAPHFIGYIDTLQASK